MDAAAWHGVFLIVAADTAQVTEEAPVTDWTRAGVGCHDATCERGHISRLASVVRLAS